MKAFENIMEFFGWLRIVASPLIIGLAAGCGIYFYEPGTARLIIAILLALAGLVVGVIWATGVWKRNGTMSFLSRVSATPDLDSQAGKDKMEKKTEELK